MKVDKDLHTLWMKFTNREFLKYLVSGVINTFATYFLYLIIHLVWEYKIAYTISYFIGILISYLLNSLFVFREKISFLKFIKFPLVYIVQYIINFIIIYVFVENVGIPTKIVPLIAIIFTVPVTFLLTRLIIKGR